MGRQDPQGRPHAHDDVTIYHNPRCATSRKTLELLRKRGIEPRDHRISEDAARRGRAEAAPAMLGLKPRELLRKKEAKEAGLDKPGLSDEQIIAGMAKHPIAIERPIVVKGKHAALGRPPEAAARASLGAGAMAADGLVTLPSSFGPKETMDRLEAAIKAKGMTVFARIDHAAGAAAAGLALRPTELLIFGNARAGTPLMQADQTIGIDLPLKALVYRRRGRQDVALLRRAALYRRTARARRGRRAGARCDDGGARCRHQGRGDVIRAFTDHAANERTYLAWVRTGIAVIAFGFVIERFNLFLLAVAGVGLAPAGAAIALRKIVGAARPL